MKYILYSIFCFLPLVLQAQELEKALEDSLYSFREERMTGQYVGILGAQTVGKGVLQLEALGGIWRSTLNRPFLNNSLRGWAIGSRIRYGIGKHFELSTDLSYGGFSSVSPTIFASSPSIRLTNISLRTTLFEQKEKGFALGANISLESLSSDTSFRLQERVALSLSLLASQKLGKNWELRGSFRARLSHPRFVLDLQEHQAALGVSYSIQERLYLLAECSYSFLLKKSILPFHPIRVYTGLAFMCNPSLQINAHFYYDFDQRFRYVRDEATNMGIALGLSYRLHPAKLFRRN